MQGNGELAIVEELQLHTYPKRPYVPYSVHTVG